MIESKILMHAKREAIIKKTMSRVHGVSWQHTHRPCRISHCVYKDVYRCCLIHAMHDPRKWAIQYTCTKHITSICSFEMPTMLPCWCWAIHDVNFFHVAFGLSKMQMSAHRLGNFLIKCLASIRTEHNKGLKITIFKGFMSSSYTRWTWHRYKMIRFYVFMPSSPSSCTKWT